MEGSLWRNFRWMNMHILSFMIARFDSNISALLFFCSGILASGRTLASAIIVPFTIIMLLQQSIISLSWLHFMFSAFMFFDLCLMWNYTHRLTPNRPAAGAASIRVKIMESEHRMSSKKLSSGTQSQGKIRKDQRRKRRQAYPDWRGKQHNRWRKIQ